MAIIQTQRNEVIAHERQPKDVFVRVSLIAPAGDGKHLRPLHLPYEPISHYHEAVDWAVSVADQMAYPIHILPLNHSDILNTARFEPFRRLLESMSVQEFGEFMQPLAVALCAALKRDRDDQQLRAVAYDLLV